MANKWITIGLVIITILFWIGARDDIRQGLDATQARPAAVPTSGYARAEVEFSDIGLTVLIPTTSALQAKGLAGRTHISDHEGMLWVYSSSGYPAFWMKDMLMPIDILWINNEVVVDRTLNVPPPTAANVELPVYRPLHPVNSVLEVAAGFATRYHIEVGDQVSIDRR